MSRIVPILFFAVGFLFILLLKRPEFLALGTITFMFGIVVVFLSLALIWLSLRGDLVTFRFLPIDLTYGATVALVLLSFLLFSRRSQLLFQVYVTAMVFIGYLLVRVLYPKFFKKKLVLFAGLVVVIASLESMRGLVQIATRSSLHGSFIHVNHMAMFIALCIPVGIGLIWHYREQPHLRRLFMLLSSVIFLVVVLSKCRSAYIGLALSLPVLFYMKKRKDIQEALRKRSKIFHAGLVLGLSIMGMVFGYLIYHLKPISAVGRLLAWRISFLILKDFPLIGVGVDNFGSYYPLYQGKYFAQGLGSPLERLSASFLPTALNDYIENLVELGCLGFLLFLVFWILVGANILRALRTASGTHKDLVSGFAGAVMVYMVMSFFYYPQRIMPVYGLCLVFLAFVVSENQGSLSKRASATTRWFSLKRVLLLTLSLCALLVSSLLLPSQYREFKGEILWKKAQRLNKQGKTDQAYGAYLAVHPYYKDYGRFLGEYGRFLLERDKSDEAVESLERAKHAWPDPFLIETLAQAYNEQEEWAKAIQNARLADNILPWRLTTKYLLAENYPRVDDIYRGLKYAELVVETPMKTPSQKGRELKIQAQELRDELFRKWKTKESEFSERLVSVPETERREWIEVLEDAGDNRGQCLQAFLAAASEERKALLFLFKHMPEKDLNNLPAKLLTDNLKYAFKVRSGFVPGEDIPEDVFLNYVVPYAQLHENRDNWRPLLYEKILPLVEEAETIEDAVFALNQKMYVMFGIVFENRRLKEGLLNPLEMIEHGAESCAGLSVLLADACRALGIPARVITIPNWVQFKSGHLWVEVYDRGEWKHASSSEPSPLSQTWFTKRAAQTDRSKPKHRIYAASFKPTDLTLPKYPGVYFIDVTDNY